MVAEVGAFRSQHCVLDGWQPLLPEGEVRGRGDGGEGEGAEMTNEESDQGSAMTGERQGASKLREPQQDTVAARKGSPADTMSK